MEKSNFFKYLIEVVLGNLGGPKFAQNSSISYGFRDKRHFPFPQKLKRAAKNRKSLNVSEVLEERYLVPLGSKICPESFYLLWFLR